MKKIELPTEMALEASIKNNIFFYYVALFTWVGFLLYGSVYKNIWLVIDATIFLIAAVNFNLSQKIDKCRLEIRRK
jgi:hypothetical protein